MLNAQAIQKQNEDEAHQRDIVAHRKSMETIGITIEQNRRKGSCNVLSLRDSVVGQLILQGFGVKFHRAAGMGDMDSHTITWD